MSFRVGYLFPIGGTLEPSPYL